MNRCEICRQTGLYFVGLDEPGDPYVVLACRCPAGQRYRTKWQLRATTAHMDPAPVWVGRLEEFFTAAELKQLRPVERTHAVVNGREQVQR